MAIPVAALAAGASALSSAMSAGGGLLTNARTLQHDDYWRNQSRKWQLADEARQNAYNAPRAQMARLRAGGLSASMAAQSIAGTGSTSAGPGTYSGPTGGPNLENPIPEKFFDAQSAITLAETIKNNERNRALTNANIANIDADTVNKGVQTSLLNLDNELRRLDLQYRKEDRPRSVQAQINNLEKDKLALLNMQADYAKTQAMIEDFKSQAAFRKGSLSVSVESNKIARDRLNADIPWMGKEKIPYIMWKLEDVLKTDEDNPQKKDYEQLSRSLDSLGINLNAKMDFRKLFNRRK